MRAVPLVIGGGGCAGLSLAVHLLEAGIEDRRILLIEPREIYRNDRSWCLWRLESHPFESCVRHGWRQWRVATTETDRIFGSDVHPYQYIPADTFYRFALERLQAAPQVELWLGRRIEAVQESASGVRIETDAGSLEAEIFFDSRPASRPAAPLEQHFRGLFVDAGRPVFDPSTATLMDFSPVGDPGEVRFFYVLPFSPRQALVEATYISPRPHPAGVYEQAIRGYLDAHYGLPDFRIEGRESGRIPMGLVPPVSCSTRIVPIGVAAGCARASTGYAFLAIQRQSRRLAAAVRAGKPPGLAPVWRPHARWLDRIFLSFLENRSDRAPTVFADLFARLPADLLVRFLADRGTLADSLRVVAAMPKAAFTGEWLRTLAARAA